MILSSMAQAVRSAPEALHAVPDFVMQGPGRGRIARGERARLAPCGLDGLSDAIRQFFKDHADGPRCLVGAVPYAREAEHALWQPAQLGAEFAPVAGRSTPASIVQLRPRPQPADWAQAVEAGLAAIAQGDISKIVLARSLDLIAEAPIDIADLLARLREDPLAHVFAARLPPRKGLPRWLIGATPELLVKRHGLRVVSHPLAGSARRRADAAQDAAAGQALLGSDKDRREHALAAEAVLDALAPFCRRLSAPDGVQLSATARMWHLGTRIEGELREAETDCATLLAALHPTPAVCGTPRAPAEALIRQLEPEGRGFYAGAVGWCDEGGDGSFHLALRCAEVEGSEARLHAGAGIVAGSTPAAEVDETAAKFLAMLGAFGLDETALARILEK